MRLGVRYLHLFDPDTLTAGNVTRVYGSYLNRVGEPKVDVIAAHVFQIAPDAEVVTMQAKITLESAARQLLDADVIFGCTDDNAGRLVLSRVASYLLTPVIDSGVLLSSGLGGQLTGIDGRVTVLAPGAACLVCRDRIDLQRAAAEMLASGEYSQLLQEGYAPALLDPQPAVVTFTTQVASAAVSELLERLIHYGPETRPYGNTSPIPWNVRYRPTTKTLASVIIAIPERTSLGLASLNRSLSKHGRDEKSDSLVAIAATAVARLADCQARPRRR